MEEIEIPTESLNEKINEEAEHTSSRWALWVALSTAMMAVLAAIAGLLAGHHSNEALIDQIKSSDQWAFYQAKGIKGEILGVKNELLVSQGKVPDAADMEKFSQYKNDQVKLKETAEEEQKSSAIHLSIHVILARAVTFFQIAIALSAISIITKRKLLWFVSLGLSCAGIFFLLEGLF